MYSNKTKAWACWLAMLAMVLGVMGSNMKTFAMESQDSMLVEEDVEPITDSMEVKANNISSSKLLEILAKPTHCDGASWPINKACIYNPACVGNTDMASGCFAYVADLFYYAYGKTSYTQGQAFTNMSEIREGDILHWGTTAAGHWIFVLGRDGNYLHVAEGNWHEGENDPGRVMISGGAHRIISDSVVTDYWGRSKTINAAYHMDTNGGSVTPSNPGIPQGTRNYFSTWTGSATGNTTAYIEANTINFEYPSECGYYYGTSESNMVFGGKDANNGKKLAKMFYNVSGLVPGTDYYFKFYSISDGYIFWTPAVKVRTNGNRFAGGADAITVTPGNLNLFGWFVDLGNYSAQTYIDVYLNDSLIGEYPVNYQRTDVGNAYPGAGNNKGFNINYSVVNEGTFTLKAYVVNKATGMSQQFASQSVTLTKKFKGSVEEMTAKAGAVYLRGWVQNAANTSDKPTVVVYIDDKEATRFTADIKRSDNRPGFDRCVVTNLTGSHTVKVYALNTSDNKLQLIYEKKLTLLANNKPKVTNAKASNITSKGYTVTCTVTDDYNGAIDHVTFKTKAGSSAYVSKNGTISGSTATINVSTSDFSGASGSYVTEIYAYDKNGAVSDVQKVNVTVPGTGYTGIAMASDGNYYLYKDGVVQSTYTGIYDDAILGKWMIVYGKIDFFYNDIYKDSKLGWVLVQGGAFASTYNGLYCSPTMGWWKVVNGKLDTNYNDLYCDPVYGWWKIVGGTIDFGYSDIYNSPTVGAWKIVQGQIDLNYSDLYYSPTIGWYKINGGMVDVYYNDIYYSPVYGWYKVTKGAVDLSYSGMYNSPTVGCWKLEQGQIDFGYSDVYKDSKYGWILVQGGAYATTYNGLYCSPTMGWWKVADGKLDLNYNDLYCDPVYGWWKIAGGTIDSGYTDIYNSPTMGGWKVVQGQVDFNYTELYCSPTIGWYKINGGMVDIYYNDIYNSPVYGWYKIANGAIDFAYNDMYNSPTMGWWKIAFGQLDIFYSDIFYSPLLNGYVKIYGGAVDWNYSDLYYSNVFGWWKVDKGILDLNYNGLYCSPTMGWWLVNWGAINFAYDGVYTDPLVGSWYCRNGTIDYNFTGRVRSNGIIYNVVGGAATPVALGVAPDGDNPDGLEPAEGPEKIVDAEDGDIPAEDAEEPAEPEVETDGEPEVTPEGEDLALDA